MSKMVTVRDLRRNIAAVLDAVAGGEQVVITRRGKSVARIIPEIREGFIQETRYPLRGSVRSVSEDFDEPIERLWEDLDR